MVIGDGGSLGEVYTVIRALRSRSLSFSFTLSVAYRGQSEEGFHFTRQFLEIDKKNHHKTSSSAIKDRIAKMQDGQDSAADPALGLLDPLAGGQRPPSPVHNT